MFPWRATSLEGKLTFLVVTVVALVITSIAYLGNRLSIQAVERNLLDTGSETANTVALELESQSMEVRRLDELISSYMEWNHQVKDIAVFALDGTGTLALWTSTNAALSPSREHYSAVETGRIVKEKSQRQGMRFWRVIVPFHAKGPDGKLVGCVDLWVSLQSADILRQQNRTRVLLTVPLSIVLLVVLIRIIFTRSVHTPLKTLEAAMARVEAGNLNSEAPTVRSDELGLISTRFNRMLGRLRGAYEERERLLSRVHRFNDELSGKVKEATLELERKNRELSRLNEELYYMQRRLARMERLNLAGQMAASFAHKMGTPLNLISGHLQTILHKRPDERVLYQKLRLVYTQVERLAGIVRDLLDETRKPALNLKPLDMNSLLERILSTVEPMLASRGVRVEKGLSSDLPPVMGDEGQLEQVFSNLLNNSLDAMPNGGTIRVVSRRAEDKVRLRFEDTGEGIPEAALSQVFRPLFTTKEIGKGTGLGLATVKEILTAHGASVHVQSQAKQGTVFVVEFPVAYTGIDVAVRQ